MRVARRRSFLAVCALLALACDGGSVAPTPILQGAYAARTIDGAVLPQRINQDSATDYLLAAELLEFRLDLGRAYRTPILFLRDRASGQTELKLAMYEEYELRLDHGQYLVQALTPCAPLCPGVDTIRFDGSRLRIRAVAVGRREVVYEPASRYGVRQP